MERKDYILREIEKISTLLLYLTGKFVPSKSIEENQLTEELINKELREQYGNDLEYILNIEKKDFETTFTQNTGFNDDNVELLADLLFTLGNNQNVANKKYLNKALALYEYINHSSKTFSFERDNKINTLKSII
ncbi:MAG: hypothetical protein KOO66_13660 [Bacteroidales bacterium]|nr:hypothetical protein [Bacteroidales bacterium]